MPFNKDDLNYFMEELSEALERSDEYLAAGEIIVGTVKPVLVKAIKILCNAGIDIREEMEPEIARMSIITAKAMHRDYKNYIKAGFTKVQAFNLTLTGLASTKQFDFGQLMKSVGDNVKVKSSTR